jgi:hypothetical protein
MGSSSGPSLPLFLAMPPICDGLSLIGILLLPQSHPMAGFTESRELTL